MARDSTTRGVYNVSTLPSVTTGPPHVLSNNTYTDNGPPSPTYLCMYSLPTMANSSPNYLCVLPLPCTLCLPSLLLSPPLCTASALRRFVGPTRLSFRAFASCSRRFAHGMNRGSHPCNCVCRTLFE